MRGFDKNTILGLILIFGILIAGTYFMSPSKEEREVIQRQQDSLAIVRLEKMQKDSLLASTIDTSKSTNIVQEQPKVVVDVPTSLTPSQARDRYGVFANSSQGEKNHFIIENDLMKIRLSSLGGYIESVELKDYKTFDSLPLILFNDTLPSFGFTFFAQNQAISTKQMFFKPLLNGMEFTGESATVKGTDSIVFSMRLYADASDTALNLNQFIEYSYTLYGGNNRIGFSINFSGLQNIIASNTTYLLIDWNSDLLKQEKITARDNGPTIYYRSSDEEVDYLSETKDEEEKLVGGIKWISFKQQFFSSTLIAEDLFSNAKIKTITSTEKGPRYLKSMEAQVEVPFNSTMDQSLPFSFYFGPNKYMTLRQYKLDLERQIPLGWSFFLMQWINRFAVLPVFNYLESFQLNYGIIILILTILLKIVLFPIAYKTYKSSAKMRILKPEVDEITAKFPKKEDAMKKQQATMALYKQAGVNPMAGCVPMLLQFPILIAMFRFFPAAFELRQESFLWAHDLSSYDSILELGFNIPFYGDHVSLFTLLMTISTLFYTYMNNQMMASTQQMPGMKTMMYLMPVMFLGFFNSYAAALSYYYFLANMFTIGQMYFIRKFINEDELHRKIQENKKKPVKKSSGFQHRLEEMAKQRGYNPKTKKK